MKKTLALLLTALLALGVFAACGNNNDAEDGADTSNTQTETVDTSKYTLQGIIDSIYAVKAPLFMYGSMPVDLEDEFSYKTYLGLEDPSVIKEAVFSESMIGAQAYSLVIARVAEGQDAAKVAEAMKNGIDNRKWVCVEADDVKTATYGDLVCFIMISTEYKDALTAQDVVDAFTKIMNGEAKYEEGAEPNLPEMPEADIPSEDEVFEGEEITDEELNQPAAMPEDGAIAEDNTPAVMPEVDVPADGGEEAVMPEMSELEAIVNTIYEDKMPQFMLGNIPVDLTDEFSYKTYLGLDDPSVIEEAIVSESMIGAQAYSLVVAKVKDGEDAEKIAEAMKAGIDPRKWICVEADDIKTAVAGNYVCFCMIDSEYAEDFTAQDAVDGFLKAVAA